MSSISNNGYTQTEQHNLNQKREMKMKIKKRHESRAQFTFIFIVMFTLLVVSAHKLMHGLMDGSYMYSSYVYWWGGLNIGCAISLAREIVLRHRAKKLAKAKKQSKAKQRINGE